MIPVALPVAVRPRAVLTRPSAASYGVPVPMAPEYTAMDPAKTMLAPVRPAAVKVGSVSPACSRRQNSAAAYAVVALATAATCVQPAVAVNEPAAMFWSTLTSASAMSSGCQPAGSGTVMVVAVIVLTSAVAVVGLAARKAGVAPTIGPTASRSVASTACQRDIRCWAAEIGGLGPAAPRTL